MSKSDVVGRYHLLHLVHQGYLGPLWAARGNAGEVRDTPALVRRVQLPADLSESDRAGITESAWDSLELGHEHLAKVAEVVFDEGAFALAYDYLESEVLQSLLLMGTVKKTPLAPEVVARILIDVVEGLESVKQSAEGLGLSACFGGVTPESIVVGTDGHARLLDAIIGCSASAFAAVRSSSGRVGYCSPEQLRGEAVDEQSDVFALGVILAELLAGRRFLLGAASAIEKKILEGRLPQVQGWLKPDAGISQKLLEVVDQAVLVDRAQRTSSMRKLVDDFCSAIAAPGSRAQVGTAVYSLAAKQLEIRAKKLGLSGDQRLSQRVGPVRGPRSSPRASVAAPSDQDKTPAFGTVTEREPAQIDAIKLEKNQEAGLAATPKAPEAERPQHGVLPEPSVVTDSNSKEGAAPPGADASRHFEPRFVMSKPPATRTAPQVDDARTADANVSEKHDEMQSGTHRKALRTLMGVAPPPKPAIVVSTPTIIMAGEPETEAPEKASSPGVADLLLTAVPATRNAPAPAQGAPAGSLSVPPEVQPHFPPPSSRSGSRSVAAAPRSPVPVAAPTESTASSQVEHYRRLVIALGAVTVLLILLLGWLIFEGVSGDDHTASAPASAPAAAEIRKADQPPRRAKVDPALSQPVAAVPASGGAPSAEVQSAGAAGADSALGLAGAGGAASLPMTPLPKLPSKPIKRKVFVPDDI